MAKKISDEKEKKKAPKKAKAAEVVQTEVIEETVAEPEVIEAVVDGEALEKEYARAPSTSRAESLFTPEELEQMLRRWASLRITIQSPTFKAISPPKRIAPEPLEEGGGNEYVYTIIDGGTYLETSKAEDMFEAGMSMCRLHYTIEKMIAILIERMKAEGIDTETEVQIAIDGALLALRKAFEVVINLNYNVIVTNFDPGEWGESLLKILKMLVDKGYGYPPEAPRYEKYRNQAGGTSAGRSK